MQEVFEKKITSKNMRQKKYNGNVEKKQNGVKGKTAALGKAAAVGGNCRSHSLRLVSTEFN